MSATVQLFKCPECGHSFAVQKPLLERHSLGEGKRMGAPLCSIGHESRQMDPVPWAIEEGEAR
jgi:hypothetical protein